MKECRVRSTTRLGQHPETGQKHRTPLLQIPNSHPNWHRQVKFLLSSPRLPRGLQPARHRFLLQTLRETCCHNLRLALGCTIQWIGTTLLCCGFTLPHLYVCVYHGCHILEGCVHGLLLREHNTATELTPLVRLDSLRCVVFHPHQQQTTTDHPLSHSAKILIKINTLAAGSDWELVPSKVIF